LFLARNHPDFLSISRPAGKSEIPVDLFTGSRDDKSKPGLLAELNLRPQRSQKRIAIIDDADLMNDEGANALLKTLEEPPPYAVLILITSQLERVISTIRSRSQIICFGDLSPAEVTEILSRESIETITNFKLDDRLSTGLSVAQVLELQEEKHQQVAVLLEQKLFSRDLDVVNLYRGLLELIQLIGGDAAAQRDLLRDIIHQTVEQCRERLYIEIDAQAPGIIAQETLLSWIERLMSAEMDLDFAMAVPLCLESLCYDLANLKRRCMMHNA
jgi:DNA polymerase-3 subunit delta'